MSNNLLPQPFPVSAQASMQMGPCINVATPNPELISKPEARLLSQPICSYQEPPAMQVGSQISVRHDYNVMVQPSFLRSGATVGSESMSVNMDTAQLLGKRKSPLQPMFNGTASPQSLSVQNKRMVPMINKGPMPVQPSSVSPRTQYLPASFVKNASVTCTKAGKQTAARIKTSQKPLLSKHQNESSESVRSKMRESLAGALAMVQCQMEMEAPKESKRLHIETATDTLVSEPVSAASDVMVSNESTEVLTLSDLSPVEVGSVQTVLPEILTINKTSDAEDIIAEGPQAKPFLEDNVSYSDNVFSKDDLLQGNDLSWALDLDIEFTENCQNEMIGAMGNDGSQERSKEKLLLDPQALAFKIEAELFKLFGGVNKKYKEKGRSLLFNLKDKNNPKLREKVMYGEIAAERLCSMSAEELASKELAEWRQAKAEEMAQMVVLQDTEVDIRSLVRKTHKGEFQVEVERMDSGSVDVSVGSSSLNWSRPKNIKKKTASITKTLGIKNELNGCNAGTGPSNGVTVDDEMHAATGSLPPIVSLDEFISCIDSESPSDSLSSDTGKSNDAEAVLISTSVTSPEESVNVDLGASPVKAEASPVKAEGGDLVSPKPCSDLKSETTSVSIPAGERVWEGTLQFSVSSASSVIGILKSGEKTTTKEWPMLLEIKGRVRLDAFEKFVRELPNSRSRAVMVLCFVCREDSPKTERENISEVVDSYAKEMRVGFAEPASGVELYLCPTRGRIVEILSKIVPRNQLDFLKSLDDDGLIGVVVWRRPQFKKPSLPSSNSYNNHHRENGSLLTSTINTSRYRNMMQQVNNHDDGGDVPPGFGPMAMAQNDDDDDDDLPEFNYFSRGDGVMNRTRRSDSVRELIHKYGKSEPLWNNQGYNDDENDILPEWQQPQINPSLGLNHVNGGSMVRPSSEWWFHQAGGGGY